jgi:serine kinase of HPr protein (carbohydrate metabolism regulator)
MERIENRVRELLNEKEWTFADLQNMENIVREFADILEKELDYGFIARLCEAEPIVEYMSKETTFGDLFWRIRQSTLQSYVAKYLKEELMNANVNFNGGDKNEVPKGSVGGKPSKKRTTDEKKNSEE